MVEELYSNNSSIIDENSLKISPDIIAETNGNDVVDKKTEKQLQHHNQHRITYSLEFREDVFD